MLRELWTKVAQAQPGKRHTAFFDAIKRGIAPKFDNTVIISRYFGPPVDPRIPSNVSIERHDSYESLLASIEPSLSDPRCELFDMPSYVRQFERRGIAWLGKVDGVAAAIRWTKFGKDVAKWYVPLHHEDIVFFSALTLPAFRGLGVHGAMIRHVLASENYRAAYVDVAKWNTSLTNFHRIGFEDILRVRKKKSFES
jgi:ribosomal protein S18 acetylase RimI-like enzyme